MLKHYNKAGFTVTRINCDMEFKSIMDDVKNKLNIELNYANAGDHVPEAECNNRTIKERFRAAYHRLPYKAMTRIMIRYLAMDCTNKLNLFPAKGGISEYYSPRTILNQRCLLYTSPSPRDGATSRMPSSA